MGKTKLHLHTRRVIIAVHDYIPSIPGENLRKFLFQQNVLEVAYIAHPLLYIKQYKKKPSRFEHYTNGKLKQKKTFFDTTFLPEPLQYIKDVALTWWWILTSGKTWDIFFGIDNLNACAAIILRELGLVKKVVYVTIDYFPNRFENKILNSIYHSIDTFCVKYADETWNVSPKMAKAREKHKGVKENAYPQFTVQGGVWYYETKRAPLHKIDRYKLIYTGNLDKVMGVDLVLRVFPRLKAFDERISLDIIGGGNELEALKKIAKDKNIEKYITFHGWVNERSKLESLLSTAGIGLAPFNTTIANEIIKNGDPGKIKDYLQLGLPVITTKVFSGYKNIFSKKCGKVISYTEDDLYNAVTELIQDKKTWKIYRENAIKYAEQFDWGNIFYPHIKRLDEGL